MLRQTNGRGSGCGYRCVLIRNSRPTCSHAMASLLFWTFLLGFLCLVSSREKRYISYTINMGEGFNLRRDVHMRVANLVRSLRSNTKYDWVLVLPPWPRLYHWKSSVPQSWTPWRNYFDLASLNEYVPSIELETYTREKGVAIDQVSTWILDGNFKGLK